MGLVLGLGRSPGVGNGNPLQYSCLGKLMDRGAWWATVLGVTKGSDTLVTSHIHTAYTPPPHTHPHTHYTKHHNPPHTKHTHTPSHVRAHTHTHGKTVQEGKVSVRDNEDPG